MDDNSKLDKKILKFLNVLANKTDNGYVWREACGLIKEIERVKKLTIPIVRSCATCVENKGNGKEAICFHCSGNLDMYEPKK